MNIVVVNDYGFLNGGAGKVAFDTAILMSQAGHRVILFTAVDPIEVALKANGVEVVSTHQLEFLHYKNKIRGGLTGLWNIKAAKQLAHLLAKLDPHETVVHVHGWTKALSASIFRTIGRMQFPCVITGHDYFLLCPNGAFYDYQTQQICPRKPLSLACLCCNCDKRSYAQKLYRSVRLVIQRKALSSFSWNIIYISDFSKKIIQPQLHFPYVKEYFARNPVTVSVHEQRVPKKNKYFIYIGRIDPEKGVDLFCEAVCRLGAFGVIIGEGSERHSLMKHYADYKKLIFTGWLQQPEWHRWLEQGKALVFPSKWYEGAPLSILETQFQYKIPAIVPDRCAASEYVMSGQNGLVFQSGSLQSLIDTMTTMESSYGNFFSNENEAELYATETHDYAAETYGENIENIYRSILKS